MDEVVRGGLDMVSQRRRNFFGTRKFLFKLSFFKVGNQDTNQALLDFNNQRTIPHNVGRDIVVDLHTSSSNIGKLVGTIIKAKKDIGNTDFLLRNFLVKMRRNPKQFQSYGLGLKVLENAPPQIKIRTARAACLPL